ncbi:DegT/DnrJ/EryC1/StrS family aminotransferase [Dyadobacter arcticus]|uniref:Pyridoxal phosphate-dependent aminotransferase EpsN n=1 Tax=Dyadobacter arcticus TaxID=1078754 RepID=A0ABX0UGC6_9BACT|nr:aminotransferase class I/II-fold pyridoxal phosphate-dependent enzyme [Dyadobacter arcticus]NIJ51099.1 pyridoxal phosphate-dependent aminotransferase EpsN [Dyadobacter arcticus]
MNQRIFLSPPHMGGTEIKYIKEAFDTNWIAPTGPNIKAFENDLCAYTGSSYAVALSSGTAAIHLALLVLGVGEGDFVLCQSLTFAASANPIVYVGATPVFIDSESLTWNICPNALEDAIQFYVRTGKKPKAIICVHLYGMPCRLNEISAICRRYGIAIIEDAAEALGSVYNGKQLGTFGDLGIFSFNGNKIITTSGGGALISNNKSYIEKALFLATQARDTAPHFQHSEIGYNYRMSNVCAGIGRGQMKVLGQRIIQRRANFNLYKNLLRKIPGINFQVESAGSLSNRWLTTIILHEDLGITPENVRLNLASQQIESRPLWKPMHLQPIFSNAPYFGSNVSKELYQTGLCLPSGSDLPQEKLLDICLLITGMVKK